MAQAQVINNSPCLKCDAINKEMIKVGAFVLCNDCFKIEFIDTGEYTEENDWKIDPKGEAFQAWTEAYKKYIGDLMESEE